MAYTICDKYGDPMPLRILTLDANDRPRVVAAFTPCWWVCDPCNGSNSRYEITHLLAGGAGEGSQGMCGQPVIEGHCATTELENVRCMACLVAEIRWYRENMKRIVGIAEGDA